MINNKKVKKQIIIKEKSEAPWGRGTFPALPSENDAPASKPSLPLAAFHQSPSRLSS